MDRYSLAIHAQNYLPWGWNTGYCVYGVYPIPCHQNKWHGHHRRALRYLGEKSNTWRVNGPWIYANHHDPYILTVNFGLTNIWIFFNGDIECSGWFSAPSQGGWNTVHNCKWIWEWWTIMVLYRQSGSSTACHPWRTFRCIPSCSSYHSDQIQYHRNSALAMDKVVCLVGWVALLVAWLEGLVMLVNIYGMEKKILNVGNKVGAYIRGRPLPIIPTYRSQDTHIVLAGW